MVVSEFLHETLYQMGLIWCGMMTIPCLAYILWGRIKKPCKRLMVWGIRKLDRTMKQAEMKRISREKAFTMYAEPISGTNGYRIKTR